MVLFFIQNGLYYLCSMLQISQRGHEMPASPIRKLVPYAEAAKKRGTKVYHLNIGQPDIETPAIMLDAVKNIDFKVWAYTHSEGIPSYREKLAGYYQKVGFDIDASNIIVTNGGSEAITIAINTCLNNVSRIPVCDKVYNPTL